MNVEVVVAPKDALAVAFAERLRLLSDAARARNGRFSWALPGGSAAEVLLPALVEAPLDWTSVDFFWGDERAVAPDHPDSNYGLARRLLLDRIAVDPGRVHPVPVDTADLVKAAEEYAAVLARALGDPPRLDLALLGVGPDGHVCSLFPGHPLLEDETRWVAPVFDSPKPPPARITLTLRALAAAEVVWVAAFGESKAEVVRAALEDPASALPLARVTRAAKRAVFFVDASCVRK